MLKFLGKAFLIIALIVAVVYGWIYFTINAEVEYIDEVKKVIKEELLNEKELANIKVVDEETKSDSINVLPTLVDTLTTNSAWCGTMQLVWNDMMDVAGGVPKFFDTNEMIENLNKRTFDKSDLSEEYYYKKFGVKTLALKSEIEKGIKDKFNETSDILDNIDWSDDALDPKVAGVDRYLFYAMLKREFEYPHEFTVLENGKFGETDDVKYFGVNYKTEELVDEQLNVLYYNNSDDFAIEIETKDSDKMVLVRKDAFETNFKDIYNVVKSKANKYKGDKEFNEVDEFKMPNIEFNVLKNYSNFAGKKFTALNFEGQINAAMQTIELKIDEKGGKIKSEAVLDVMFASALLPEEEPIQPRYFYLDDEFVIFLVEDGKNNPYFAAKIDDITLFQ